MANRPLIVQDVLGEKGPNHHIICINENDTVQFFLSLTKRHDLISLPVVDDNLKFLGFVDTMDLALMAFDMYEQGFCTKILLDSTIKNLLSKFFYSIQDYSGTDDSYATTPDALFESVALFFAQKQISPRHHHPQRMAVLDDLKHVNDILTLTDLVRFFYARKELIPVINNQIGNTFSQPVVKVRIDQTFEEALRLIKANKVRGLATVDENGHFVGEITAQDLRGITFVTPGLKHDSFNYMNKSVSFFSFKAVSKDCPFHVQSQIVSKADTFLNVLSVMAENHLSQVYVVDEFTRPIGVCSAGDLIQSF